MQQLLDSYITKEFQEGQNAWNSYYNSLWVLNIKNPYKNNTKKWFLWNKGWNTNFKGIKK